MTKVLRRCKRREDTERRRQVKIDTLIGVMHPQAQECLEFPEAGRGILPSGAPEGAQLYQNLDFRILAPELRKNELLLFKPSRL